MERTGASGSLRLGFESAGAGAFLWTWRSAPRVREVLALTAFPPRAQSFPGITAFTSHKTLQARFCWASPPLGTAGTIPVHGHAGRECRAKKARQVAAQESGRFPAPTRVLERAPSSGQWCGSRGPWRPGSPRTCSCCRFKTVQSPLNKVTSSAAHAVRPRVGLSLQEEQALGSWGKFTPRVPSTCPPGLCEALLPPPPRTPAGRWHPVTSPLSLQIYPDESHYFHSAPLRQHLHHAIINFFVECFRVQDKPPAPPAKEEEED